MTYCQDLHVALLHNGALFGLYTHKGEVVVDFNYGHREAILRLVEFGKPIRLTVIRLERQGEDFQRLGALLWPLYEKATSDEWPAALDS